MKNMNQDSPAYKAILLGIMCAVCGLLLSLVNSITEPMIKEAEIAAVKANLEIIFPGTTYEEIKDFKDETGMIQAVYEAKDQGYAFKIHGVGYNSSGFTFMTGIANTGEIKGYMVLEHGETSGIGSRAFEDDYISKITSLKQGDDVPLLTGATLTSTAVKNGINAAYAVFGAMK